MIMVPYYYIVEYFAGEKPLRMSQISKIGPLRSAFCQGSCVFTSTNLGFAIYCCELINAHICLILAKPSSTTVPKSICTCHSFVGSLIHLNMHFTNYNIIISTLLMFSFSSVIYSPPAGIAGKKVVPHLASTSRLLRPNPGVGLLSPPSPRGQFLEKA